MMQPKLILHGGAGSALQNQDDLEAVRQDLRDIAEAVYSKLIAGADAPTVVAYGCQLLESHPRFNAGYGSVLQADGQIRMSASLMDGTNQRFSGVINVSRVEHPIDLAVWLQACPDRVLSDLGAAELAREMGLPLFDPLTDRRLQEWMQERANNFQRSMAGVIASDSASASPPETARHGTIGVVCLDQSGHIAAGTSTGGKGLERIGRVSDSATPAGNYATATAGVSCTGIGEDIIDECLAARIVVRVTDGMNLHQAFSQSLAEAEDHRRDLGAIGIDQTGAVAWGKTSDVLLAAYHTGVALGDTLALAPGCVTGVC